MSLGFFGGANPLQGEGNRGSDHALSAVLKRKLDNETDNFQLKSSFLEKEILDHEASIPLHMQNLHELKMGMNDKDGASNLMSPTERRADMEKLKKS